MNVVFCGTGAFGVPALHALVQAGMRPKLVVTQPDRPAGRKRELKASPIKEAAVALGLPLFQPERINREEALAVLRAEAPDVLVVVAYGQILRRAVLDLPRLGCVNLHGSILPRHRGASPIAAAIAAGDAESGVAAMLMDEGLDTGPVLGVVREPVRPDDDTGLLHDRLSALGAPLLVSALADLAAGRAKPVRQDDAEATVCRTLSRDDSRLDWTKPAIVLERLVRAMRPWPGAWTTLVRENGVPAELGILQAAVSTAGPEGGSRPVAGTVLAATPEALIVAAGEGALRLVTVKPAGKTQMDAAAFVRGRQIAVGDVCR